MRNLDPISLGNEAAILSFTERGLELNRGLTKREVFAAMAMQWLMSNPEFSGNDEIDIASWSVHQADALLEQLAK